MGKETNIINYRLSNQQLLNLKFNSAEETVSHLGAVQAQDFNAAKWSLGLRVKNTSNKNIENDFNDGKILRTHIMRPTWHFVSPENLYWIQKLSSDRVKRLMNHYNKKLELTDVIFEKTNRLLSKWLKDKNYLTRQGIKVLLENEGIKTNVQRLGHIVMWAELDALICSGPLRGKQHTYGLFSERVSKQKSLDREGSLAELARLYFQSHGPALIKDFSWWSGLTMKDAALGVLFNKPKLGSEIRGGKEYWFFSSVISQQLPAKLAKLRLSVNSVLLLSVYDEYFIGYTDRSLILEEEYKMEMAAVGNALLTSLVVSDGKVIGTWKRTLRQGAAEIKVNLFRKLSSKERELLEEQIKRYSIFYDIHAKIAN